MKAGRYAREGVANMSGDPLVHDIDGLELLGQTQSFTPARISDQYDQNNALKRIEQRILKRRRFLMDQFSLAVRMEDDDRREEVLQDMAIWNAKNSEVAITGDALMRSLKMRAQARDKSLSGIQLNKKLRARLLEKEFVSSDSD